MCFHFLLQNFGLCVTCVTCVCVLVLRGLEGWGGGSRGLSVKLTKVSDSADLHWRRKCPSSAQWCPCCPSSSRPHLHVYGAAHNSGARGPVSSSGPHREPIVSACRCLRSHAAPSAASCRWGSAVAGLGGAASGLAGWGWLGFQCQRGAVRVGSGRFWPAVGAERGFSWISSGVLPAAVGTIIYSHALTETLVNRPQRSEIISVWVQQPPALHCNNEVCVTHRIPHLFI